MSRWPSDARGRLEQAAMELFATQGFAATTVPQITGQAGLTTRTFFRHFADKREVLFGVEAELPDVVQRIMADAPASGTTMDLIRYGLERVAATRFDGLFEYLRARRSVIRSDAGLQERELSKLSLLAATISAALRARGLDDDAAQLAAGTAVTILTVALDRWLDQDRPDPPAAHAVRATLDTYQALTAPAPAAMAVEAAGSLAHRAR